MKRRATPGFRHAVTLLDTGRASEVLDAAEALVASSDEADRLDGYFCKGMAYEDGGVDLEPDLDRSLDNYRRASLIAPGAITFMSLARVSLKKKDHPAARRFLDISANYEVTPETLLGFGHYFEDHLPEGATLAK